MRAKAFLIIIFTLLVIVFGQPRKTSAYLSNQSATYRGNSCIACHSQINQPLSISTRYYEWHTSTHKEKGVSCEKCHGGDPAANDKAKAHTGIRPYADEQSRIHYRNLPATCASCHRGIVNSFIESKHYQKLQSSNMGPSCSTCHGHMASQVLVSPQQTSTLCAYCHDTINGLLRPRPDIREKTEMALQSLNRAGVAVEWANSLLREAETKKLYIPIERMEAIAAQGSLKEAKFNWHTFDLEATLKKADEAFQTATKAREDLGKKLNH